MSALATALESASRGFFALDTAEKMRIRMDLGGRAWRGYFPVGGELTSGIPDDKEGLYFGAELDERDPRVIAATPLHGRNLFPQRPDLRDSGARMARRDDAACARVDAGHRDQSGSGAETTSSTATRAIR